MVEYQKLSGKQLAWSGQKTKSHRDRDIRELEDTVLLFYTDSK